MHFHNPGLTQVARDMRNNPTPAERKLWRIFLKDYVPRFQRQKSILRFVADFYCAKARLVIELDGGYHNEAEQAERDEARTEIIEKLDIRVIRFTNEDVEKHLTDVIAEIKRNVEERVSKPLNYSEGMD